MLYIEWAVIGAYMFHKHISCLFEDVNGLCGTNTDHESYETPSAYLKMQYATYNLPHSPQTFQAVITPFHYGKVSA